MKDTFVRILISAAIFAAPTSLVAHDTFVNEPTPSSAQLDGSPEEVDLDSALQNLSRLRRRSAIVASTVSDLISQLPANDYAEVVVTALDRPHPELQAGRVDAFYFGYPVEGASVNYISDLQGQVVFATGRTSWPVPTSAPPMDEQAVAAIQAELKSTRTVTKYSPDDEQFVSYISDGNRLIRFGHSTLEMRETIAYDEHGHHLTDFVALVPDENNLEQFSGSLTSVDGNRSTYGFQTPSGNYQYNLKTTWSYGLGNIEEYWWFDRPEIAEFTATHGVTPEFKLTGSCTGSNKTCREINNFYWIKRARDYLRSNVYLSSVSPIRSGALTKIVVNSPYSSSWFSPVFNDIVISASHMAPGVLWHEYGHKFAHHYGDLSGTCSTTVHSDSIAESIADVMAQVIARKISEDTEYGRWVRIGNSDERAHRSSTSKIKLAEYSCSDGIYEFAGPFEQATWEVLYDIDCDSIGSCDIDEEGPFNGSTSSSNIGWTSRGQARVAVARGIASAVKASANDVSYSTFASNFLSYIATNYNSTIYNSVDDVFEHHGF